MALMLGAETARAVASAPSTRPPHLKADDAQPALEVRRLRCIPQVNDVSFKVYPGEVLGVAALEGQGQEELFDCIAGSRRYDQGAIFARGKELRLRHPADAIAAGVVLVPANRLLALLQQRPIPENIALPAFRRIRNWGPIRFREERKRVASAIERLQIDTRAGSELRRLSGGNQQKVVVARWLASGFDILLCFDPTRGIDIRHETPDLRVGPGNGGCGIRGAAVHFGTSRDRARLRSGDRPVRWARGRRDASVRGR